MEKLKKVSRPRVQLSRVRRAERAGICHLDKLDLFSPREKKEARPKGRERGLKIVRAEWALRGREVRAKRARKALFRENREKPRARRRGRVAEESRGWVWDAPNGDATGDL